MEPRDVNLYIYDITKGLARQLSQALLGKQLDGIWHTGVVIFGREYFFGGGGIESCRPGGTILGPPDQVHRLGSTQVTYSLFLEYLGEMGMSNYSGDKYNLFDHNCNNFSNEVSQFLTGNPIPSYITDLPQEVLNTPIGVAMKPIIDALASDPTGSGRMPPSGEASQLAPSNNAQGQSKVATGTETKSTSTASSTKPAKDNGGKRKGTRPATEGGNNDDSDDSDDLFLQKLRQRRQQSAPTRLCLFKEADPVKCADSVKTNLPESLLSADELAILEQMKVAFVAPSDSLLDDDWDKVLPPIKPDYFLVIGKLLSRTDLPPMVLLPLLQLMQLAFLREDVIGLLCTNDDHTIIDFVSRCECQTQKVQVEILHLLCNMCSSRQGYAWLMSNKEWMPPSSSGAPASNAKIIKAILIPMLLSGANDLCCAASSLVYNFSRYQVSDDHAVDFASAILQMLTTAEYPEPTVFYSVSALYGLMQFGEVICLANIMGFDLDKYVGISDRMNQLILDMGVIIGK